MRASPAANPAGDGAYGERVPSRVLPRAQKPIVRAVLGSATHQNARSPRGRLALHNPGMTPRIRDATAEDWPAIWSIVRDVVLAADTFPCDPAMTEDEGRALWMVASPGRTTVAVAHSLKIRRNT